MHEWGATSVLISGGFKALADRVQRRTRIHHSFAGCDYFFDPVSGAVDHVNLLPADEEGKVDFMRLMCREFKVDPMDCVFVGDGRNDVPLAGQVGCSIAFNAQEELRCMAHHCIDQPHGREDFMAVTRLIEQEFAN
jgi:phosphoserine phosphatase